MWQGYLRPDRRKGVRNVILVIYTVECAQFVAHAIAGSGEDVHVIGFPGCFDNPFAVRLILALARHPNVGAVLAVGLGCEYTQPARIADIVRQSGRPADAFFIQDAGGTTSSIEKGRSIVGRLRERIREETPRVPMGMADLAVACKCGGSDASSGLAGNPVVGAFFDRLIDSGGTALIEEITEMVGLRDILCARAVNEAARLQLAGAYDKTVEYCRSVRQFSASPGNFAGGLTTIEEKSMGAFAKSGSRPIQGLLKVSQAPAGPGLWVMDSVSDPHFMQFGLANLNDTEVVMALLSAGAHIVLFVTGRGSVIGSPIAPMIKITGNSRTYRHMRDDMDFDASRVLTGERTMEEAAGELQILVQNVAAGRPSKPEALGHREYAIISKHQDTPSLAVGCRA